MTFEPNMPTIDFLSKPDNIGQMCVCKIVKLESEGQQLLVTKKNPS